MSLIVNVKKLHGAQDAGEFKVGMMVRFKNGEYKGKVFRLQEFQGGYARLISPIGGVQIPKHLLKDEVSVVKDSEAKAQDAWNVNDSKLIDEISRESVSALQAFTAYLKKQRFLVNHTKEALAKAKQGGNLAEIKWLTDAYHEYESELRKAQALI